MITNRTIEVEVGVAPAAVQRGQKLVRVHFHSFIDLDSAKDHAIDSHKFNCFNHDWVIQLCPGGASSGKDDMVSVYLRHLSGNEVTVYFNLVIRDSESNMIKKTSSCTFTQRSLGWDDFIERSVLLEPGNLSNGTLTIEVQMKLDEAKSQMNFVPINPHGSNMCKLFLDADTADVLFDVSGVQFHAHRLVLKACAPELARLCEDADETTRISIPDVEPGVFRLLLKYVYGGEVYADWKKYAKKIMDSADKYGITGLKVNAESWYVTYGNLTVDTVIEDLLYADGKKCPLLREAAMEFITKNAKEVIQSDSFKDALDAKEIAMEIMLGMANVMGNDSGDTSDRMMSVNDLRMALEEKGLDIDGCREMLVSRLKN